MSYAYDSIYSVIKRAVDSFKCETATAAVNLKLLSHDRFMLYFLTVYKCKDNVSLKAQKERISVNAKSQLKIVEDKIKKDIKEVFGKSLNWAEINEDSTVTKTNTVYNFRNPLSTFYHRHFKVYEISNLDSFEVDRTVKMG